MLSISMGKLDPDLLKRYSNGYCTEEEKTAVEYWLEYGDEEPENPVPENTALEEEIWNEMIRDARPVVQRYHFRHFAWLAAAASILIVMGLFLFHDSGASEQPETLNTLNVPNGRQVTLKLADHSVICLSGGSSIRYPRSFDGSSREVTLLEGEAFFNISHDSTKPFLVHTSSSSIRVLGTKFNVGNSRNSDQVFVTLTEGSIRFQTKTGKSALLKPGQQLVFLKKQQLIQAVTPIDTSMATSWTKGLLWFDHTPVSDVLEKLERHYGVIFYNPKGLKLDAKVTAKFHEQPISRVLGLIENFTNLHFSQQGKQIHIL
ncbi:FecR family protein [Pedobacter caeni]|uniref:FecR family protein n=1 Tax=Pedobacter caeni TaxID=288992 RepID=A0A1M5KYK5_9SPHI|nr:FecR family protein [Pedobacter caeni]SHG57904.1 FecR family protein [Pedobacter caeni]